MQSINLNLVPGSFQQVFNCSQGDIGRQLTAKLFDGSTAYEIPAGSTVKIKATKPSGFGFDESATFSGSTVTITTAETMTNEWGRFPAELVITKDGNVIGTANFLFNIEKNPHPDSTVDGDAEEVIPELTLLVERVEAAASSVLDMEVVATTLPAGSQASYSYDEDLNKATFGIPQGEAGAGAAGVVASAYSSSKTYKVGDYVIHNSNLYRCITAITTAEAFTDAHWTQIVLADDVSDLKTDLQEAIDEFAVPTQEAVDNWLEAHPEATTTVEDGSLTEAKFTEALKLKTINGYVTPQMFGGKGDGLTDDTESIKSAINYALENGVKVFVPAGTYIIGETIILAATAKGWTAPCARLLLIQGESESIFKASNSLTNAMFKFSDSEPFYAELRFDTIILDGNGLEVTLIDMTSTINQRQVSAVNSKFGNITGNSAYCINSYYGSVILDHCVLQGVGSQENGANGIVARTTAIQVTDCKFTYFCKAVIITKFSEATGAFKNCWFQVNYYDVFFNGGLQDNFVSFINCYFVESRSGYKHFAVADPTKYEDIGNVSVIGCQFDGFNSDRATPVIDLNFGNMGGTFTFIGCNVWTATGDYLVNVKVSQFVHAEFINCPKFKVITNNNPNLAIFLENNTAVSYVASVSGANTRLLNYTRFNKIANCSLSQNKITLPAGVYYIDAYAECYNGHANMLQIRKNADDTILIRGLSNYSSNNLVYAELHGSLVLTETTVLKLCHVIDNADPNGLIYPVSALDANISAEIIIRKEA